MQEEVVMTPELLAQPEIAPKLSTSCRVLLRNNYDNNNLCNSF